MQTAAQIPNPIPPLQEKSQADRLIMLSFILGILLIFPLLFMLLAGWIGTRIQLETGIPLLQIRNLVIIPAGMTGLVGLAAATVGITRMKLKFGAQHYGLAIPGFVLCFAAFSHFLFMAFNSFGNIVGSILYLLQ